jgi:hypothetical protein
MESRVQIDSTGGRFVGKSPNHPPTPPGPVGGQPTPITFQSIDEAMDLLRDTMDATRDEDSRCGERTAGKLEALLELLKETRRGPTTRALGELSRKSKDM